eukprot:COSAG03_NODE_6165_length_1103_cov_31.076693_1_plen_33_part_10
MRVEIAGGALVAAWGAQPAVDGATRPPWDGRAQ